MDNVTHALAGLALAEAAGQLRRTRSGRPDAGREPSPGFRTAAAAAGAVAANLPDADLLYTTFAPDKLGYLLHHRGYTHTLVAAVVGAVLTWAVTLALWRRRARRAPHDVPTTAPDAADRRWLLGLTTVAVLSHLALDWTNNYGVHPFWPVDNRWRYGDTVFIVEPWLWVAAAAPLVWAARRRAARAGLALVLAAAPALAWAVPLVSRGAALALTVGAAAAVALAGRLGPGRRAALALGGWLAVELAFAAGAGAARRQVERATREAAARAGDPGALLADVVVTPAPANPLCATAMAVEASRSEAAGPGRAVYRVTTAWAAAAPALLPVARCLTGDAGAGGLALARSPRAPTAAVRWDRTWEAPLAELAALARGNCRAAAFLRFARVPFWAPAGADSVRVGDLRYARGPTLGFADLVAPARPTRCPAAVPPWRPPRADLLGD